MVRRRWVAVLAGLALALAGAMAAAALPATREDTPDLAQVLAAARGAVEGATSFRFVVREQTHIIVRDESAGSVSPERTSIEGVWSDGRLHTLTDGSDEAVVDGDTAYSRPVESAGAGADHVWTMTPDDSFHDENLANHLQRIGMGVDNDQVEFVADKKAVEAAAWIYLGGADASIGFAARATGGYIGIAASILGGFAGAPIGFVEAIAELGVPAAVDEANGVTVLVATLRAPDDLVEAFGHPIPEGTVQLEVGPDHRPTALRVRIERERVWSQTEVAFTDWNEPVDIPVPSGDEVDATPWLNEEGLRELTGLTLVAPTALPEGWGLAVSSTDDSGAIEPGLDECMGLQLDWYAPIPEDVLDDLDDGSTYENDYFSTLLTPVDCALDEDPTPFQPGGPGGLPSRTDPNLAGQVEVLMGDTTVAVDSSFPVAERDAIIATLAPVDVETLIASASERPPGW